MTEPTEQPLSPTYRFVGDMGPLFSALAKAQANFKPIIRSKTVRVTPRNSAPYTFNYAPLEDVLACTVPSLSAEGLCLIQPPGMGADGRFAVVTVLAHSSGAYIESRIDIPTKIRAYNHDTKEWYDRDKTPQEIGSSITYLRRYMAQGLVCVNAEEDDDGSSGSDMARDVQPREGQKTQATPPKPQSKAAQQSAPSATATKPPEPAKPPAEQPTLLMQQMGQMPGPQTDVGQQNANAPSTASTAPSEKPVENGKPAPSTPPAEGQRVTPDTAKKMSGLMKELGFTPEQTREWCVKLLGKPPKDCRLETEYLVLIADLEARKAAT